MCVRIKKWGDLRERDLRLVNLALLRKGRGMMLVGSPYMWSVTIYWFVEYDSKMVKDNLKTHILCRMCGWIISHFICLYKGYSLFMKTTKIVSCMGSWVDGE